jgi:hypothetical protein
MLPCGGHPARPDSLRPHERHAAASCGRVAEGRRKPRSTLERMREGGRRRGAPGVAASDAGRLRG